MAHYVVHRVNLADEGALGITEQQADAFMQVLIACGCDTQLRTPQKRREAWGTAADLDDYADPHSSMMWAEESRFYFFKGAQHAPTAADTRESPPQAAGHGANGASGCRGAEGQEELEGAVAIRGSLRAQVKVWRGGRGAG